MKNRGWNKTRAAEPEILWNGRPMTGKERLNPGEPAILTIPKGIPVTFDLEPGMRATEIIEGDSRRVVISKGKKA